MAEDSGHGNPWRKDEPRADEPATVSFEKTNESPSGASAYGSEQYGQPTYGDPQSGQPQYGQPQYGQPQYGQPTYGQPPYGQPAYGPSGSPAPYGYYAPRTDQNAAWALGLSIASWVVCPIVPAVIALFLARAADRNIRASNGTVGGSGMVLAARIISWVQIGVAVAALVFFLVVLLIAGVASSGGS